MLDLAEKGLLKRILEKPKEVKYIPNDWYNKYYNQLMQEERYEDLRKLYNLRNIVLKETLDELFEEYWNKFGSFEGLVNF